VPDWTTQGDPRPPDPNALQKLLVCLVVGTAIFGALKLLGVL
jgi:hypothetical protein